MQDRKARAIGGDGEYRSGLLVPPEWVVPYRVFPDKTNPPYGFSPSLLLK